MRPTLTSVVKKIHIYLGLVNLVILLVFGVAGATAFIRRSAEPKEPVVTAERQVSFQAVADSTDRQVAESVARLLGAGGCFPAGSPPRDANRNLLLRCHSSNGGHRVTVFESENRLLVQTTRNSLWVFLENIHALMPRDAITVRSLSHRLWSYYVEFSIWCLSALCLTGLFLWLATRPRYRWAWLSFAASSVLFAILWSLGR